MFSRLGSGCLRSLSVISFRFCSDVYLLLRGHTHVFFLRLQTLFKLHDSFANFNQNIRCSQLTS